MLLNDDALDKTVSFESILGEIFRNYKFTDILSASTVTDLGFDAAARHQSYRTSLPPGTVDDYRGYKYAKFIDQTGKALYMGVPWIKPTSIIENSSPVKRYTFPTLSPDQERSLSAMLTASGIENFTVEVL